MTFRRSARLFVVVMLLFGSVVATAASSAARQDDESPALRLKSTEVSPDARPDAAAAQLNARGQGYYVAQFGGPILQEQADALKALGGELMAYVPDFAYKVRMTAGAANRASSVDGVTQVSAFEADYKLSPDLAAEGLYTVTIERGVSRADMEAAVAAAGVEVVSANGRVMTVLGDAASLQGVADIADVAWIENFEFREKHNEYGAGVIIGANTANTSGYDGSTQIVAVADTGLGDGTAAGAHEDIPSGRIVDVQDWPGTSVRGCYQVISDGAQDVDSGHGTHVSVSVLGDGAASGLGQGTAPAASLVFQATEDFASFRGACAGNPNGYYLLGLPDDLEDLLQAAYDQGARIHSDSWGSDAAGDYTTDAASVDNFMWLNQDFLMTTSAGNAGVDGNSNGVVDDDSTGSPATAKNVLTVGASENDRGGDWSCDSGIGNGCTGQNDIFTYGSAWPADFPANPVANDPSAGNAEQMAAFSSRGPTDDGRIKPDVVAPGTWILSGYSDLYQEGNGVTNPQNGAFQYDGWGYPANGEYKYMGGTSMSNPITAGAAAVIRDYYNKAHSHEASGALTKATLINTAVDLLDENNDGFNDNDFPIPNSHEGWGRVDLANAVDGSGEYVDDATGVTTGGEPAYTFTTDGGTDLKVTLVWSDFPSTETASVNLVNDLDLVVTGPGGTFNGNVFSGGWSTTGGSSDRVNNVENVYIQNAAAGTWTVTVNGFNVPMGPQPFALVVDGTGTPAPNDPPAASFTSSCSDLTCDFTDTSTDGDGTVTGWDWDFGGDGSSAAQNPSHTFSAAGTYTVTLTATDNDGDSDTTTSSVTVTEPGANNPPAASFTSSCSDLTCDFTDASSDSDGTIASWAWVFGDGNTSSSQNPSHTYAAAGTFSVSLTVTDDDGATDTASSSVTVSEPTGGSTTHIAALTGASVSQGGASWLAIVTVTVEDDNGDAVDGATVTGTWRRGEVSTCSTDGTGTCTIEFSTRGRRNIFTVNDISHGSLTYDSGDNVVTSVTVDQP